MYDIKISLLITLIESSKQNAVKEQANISRFDTKGDHTHVEFYFDGKINAFDHVIDLLESIDKGGK
tara:strand:- start:52 stop:249 length:198 start_codon:yes stop_codon:yes gene_type:complete